MKEINVFLGRLDLLDDHIMVRNHVTSRRVKFDEILYVRIHHGRSRSVIIPTKYRKYRLPGWKIEEQYKLRDYCKDVGIRLGNW